MVVDAVTRVVDFAIGSRDRDLPADVLHAGRRAVLNVLGASAGAMETEPIRVLRAWAARGGPGPRRVLWVDEALPEERAALVNAAAMHVLDFDDTLVGFHVHGSPIALATALAVADPDQDGGDLLRAFCLGIEVHFALARALMPELFRRGFHISAVGGPVSAAVVAGTLLGLDAERMRAAVATAMISSGGLREGLVSMSNAYGFGHAARTGITAVRLAEVGLRSAPTAFDGPDGFLRAFSGAPAERAEAELAALGQRWLLPSNSHKRFPTETISQAPVQATLAVRGRVADGPGSVAAAGIRVAASPLVAEIVADRSAGMVPGDVLQRTFDTRYCVASAWSTGTFSPASMHPPADLEADVLALRDRVEVVPEPAFGNDSARVTVTLEDGSVLEETVLGYLGSAADPMTDDQLEEKLRTAGGPDPARHARICRAVWGLGNGVRSGDLVAELGPLRGAPGADPRA